MQNDPTVSELVARLGHVEDALRSTNTTLRRVVKTLEGQLDVLKELGGLNREQIKVLRRQVGLDHDDEASSFEAFVAAHPELTAPPARLELPDDQTLIAALGQASGRRHRPISAREVAHIALGGMERHSEAIRVGHALSRLAREGRIVRHGSGRNGVSYRYSPVEGAAS
jgi:hypothetical protein